ncbi:MAG: UDP-N-acetylglucosamine 1-carboxyvinyltransferase [Parcubacteria group bacterium]|nr:UDP-N-acetylglucosamine 1-carboxyvinyltransferase [Parcubacteria group bacterium]
MADAFLIKGLDGAKTLSGIIAVNGSKNAALPALALPFLFSDTVILENVPALEDIHRVEELLQSLGVLCKKQKPNRYELTAQNVCNTTLSPDIAKRLRASILFTGPLLARFGRVSFPHPGGCVIGERPIDLFMEGFEKMGARVNEKNGMYDVIAPKNGLRGADIFFRTQSVTAAETFLMAAVLARGKTILRNVPVEPEIGELVSFLQSRGARISGAETHRLEIIGGEPLSADGVAYSIIPDRIETGSFLILSALAGKKVTITRCNPEHVGSVIAHLRSSGVNLLVDEDTITITSSRAKRMQSFYKSISMKTHEYPGFPTDLQAPMAVFLTQADGEALIFETIFEGRLGYVPELVRMGAKIQDMGPHKIFIQGGTPLRGRELESPDLRAGLAFIIAALVAKGESIVHNAYSIDRGYEQIEKRLQKIGVSIKRISA